METLGPKYPFGPLPPINSPSASNKADYLPAKRVDTSGVNPSVGYSGNVKDFATVLNDKKAEALIDKASNSKELETLEKTAKDLEAFFIYTLLKKFYAANMKSELFPKSAGSDIYMDMFLENVANQVSQSQSGLGLSDLIVKSLESNLDRGEEDNSDLSKV
jgi:Rod binding domain-containing protein